VYVSYLGLRYFSGLVCDLLLRWLNGFSAKSALPERHPDSQFDDLNVLLAGHLGPVAPLSTLVGGVALCFLVVWWT